MSTIAKVLSAPPSNYSSTLSSNITDTDLTIGVNSVIGLGTEGIGVIYAKDSDGLPIVSSIEFVHWTSLSGNNLSLTDTNDRGVSGSASGAQAHTAGDTFEVWIHPDYYFRDFALVEHNADGTHNITGMVTETATQTLTNKTLSSPDITDPVVTGIYDNGNSGTTKTIDWSNGDVQKVTMTGNCTFTYSNAVAGQRLTLLFIQDATGSRTPTLPTSLYPGGTPPTFSTTASAIDAIVVIYDGTNYLTQLAGGFA